MDSHGMLDKACEDFSKFVVFNELWSDPSSHYVVQREANFDKILTRLDEFQSFAQSLRQESLKTSGTLIPALTEQAKRLQEVYAFIDSLVVQVAKMQQTVTQLEERANLLSNSPQFRQSVWPFAAFRSASQTNTTVEFPHMEVPNSVEAIAQMRATFKANTTVQPPQEETPVQEPVQEEVVSTSENV
ncbi:hypothetical protein Pelo_11395 [Pelomyxa schiedti]|nr:hypothetical protein Pelo_11395 [Pelomyxa schiedti]